MKKEYGATLSTYASKKDVKKKPDPFSKMGGKHTTQITKERGEFPIDAPIYRGHITFSLKNRLYAFNANDFFYSLAYRFVCYGGNMTQEEFGNKSGMSADDFRPISGNREIRGVHYEMGINGVYELISEPEHLYAGDAAYHVMDNVAVGMASMIGLDAGQFYRFMCEAIDVVSRVFRDFVSELSMREISSHQIAVNAEAKVFRAEDQVRLKERYIKQLEQELADHKAALAKVHEVFISAGNKDAVQEIGEGI